jgi:hypothetical protein
MPGFSTFDVGGCCCPPCTHLFTVQGCNNLPYPGVTVSVYTASGGTLLDSDTTDGSGQVLLSWTGAAGNYWVTVTGISSRFTAFAQSISLTCGGSHTLNLVPTSSYACWAGCVVPVARTLHVSFSPAYLPNITLTSTGGQWQTNLIRVAYAGCGACIARNTDIQVDTHVISGVEKLRVAWYWVDSAHGNSCPGIDFLAVSNTDVPVTTLTCPPAGFQATFLYDVPNLSQMFCTATTATVIE